jgi:hypothetical protein
MTQHDAFDAEDQELVPAAAASLCREDRRARIVLAPRYSDDGTSINANPSFRAATAALVRLARGISI